MSSDPWAEFSDWTPAQTQQGIDPDLLAAYPDLHSRFFASQAPGNAGWSATNLPPLGALVAAPSSFGAAAVQPTGGPWAAFPEQPPTQAQDHGYFNPDEIVGPQMQGSASPNTPEALSPKRSLTDKLFGLTGERYQLWPEVAARDFIGLPQRLTEAMNAAPVDTRQWIENVIGPATDLAMLGLPFNSAILPPGALPAAEQSIWKLGWAARGRAAEDKFRSGWWPPGFRVVDDFPNRIAISYKSIDLNAPTYQNPEAISRILNRYTDILAAWKGQPRAYVGVSIRRGQIRGKTLHVIVPEDSMNAVRQRVFDAAATRANLLDIKLIVTPVP
jgi:hypothetical protein